jgi:hypothetical protein
MNLLRRFWNHRILRPAAGALAGAGAGVAYYLTIGCNSGVG